MYWTICFYSALISTVIITVLVLLSWETIIKQTNSEVWYKPSKGYYNGHDYRPLFWISMFLLIPWIIFGIIWIIGWSLLLGYIIYLIIRNNDKIKKIIQVIQEEEKKEE